MIRIIGSIQPSRPYPAAGLAGCFLLLVSLAVSDAQVRSAITPDGTLGTRVTPDGRVFGITGGTRPDQGPNLFHSFAQFDIDNGDTAHFVGQPGIDNIIGRVTGGNASHIDGRLRSDASLFLLNPSGLMFGPNAALDVNGSFHASTADVLRFDDGAAFSTHLNEKSTMTVAAPAAFGFLGADPAEIAIEGSDFQVPQGKRVSVVGGDIAIRGGALSAPSGQLNLVSVASTGDVPIRLVDQFTGDTAARMGRIDLMQETHLDASGAGGGAVLIRSGHLSVDRATVAANTLGDRDGVGLSVQVSGDVVLTHGSSFTTRTSGAGAAGTILIIAGHVHMDEATLMSSSSPLAGGTGDIAIQAESLTLQNGGIVGNIGLGGGTGDIAIQAESLTLQNGGIVGNISFGGDIGNIVVDVRDTVSIVSQASPSGLVSFSAGEPGTIALKASSLSLDGGIIGAPSLLLPPDFVSIPIPTGGRSGDISIEVGALMAQNHSFITSLTATDGPAGNVWVEAENVTLTGGSEIDSTTSGAGQGGSVTITATEGIVITGRHGEGVTSGVLTVTIGQGRGGDIMLSAPRVQLTDKSSVSAESAGNGDAGNIRIAAQEVALRADSAVTTAAGQGEASGGNIFIGGTISDDGGIAEAVETLTLDGSQITADTDTGSGANIIIGVQRLVLDGVSALTANTGAGIGGNLRVAGAVAADGAITARADTVVLRGSRLTANAGLGMGGRIDIVTALFLADPASVVDASSQAGGIDGVVNVEAVVSDPSEIVPPLSPGFASAAALLRDRCAAQLQVGAVSSLVARDRASVPATPESILPSRLYQPGPMSALSPETERQPGETAVSQQAVDDLQYADALIWQEDAFFHRCQMLMQLQSP